MYAAHIILQRKLGDVFYYKFAAGGMSLYYPTNTLRDTTNATYKNCYMFRHWGAIFRELWQQWRTSQPLNIFLCFVDRAS